MEVRQACLLVLALTWCVTLGKMNYLLVSVVVKWQIYQVLSHFEKNCFFRISKFPHEGTKTQRSEGLEFLNTYTFLCKIWFKQQQWEYSVLFLNPFITLTIPTILNISGYPTMHLISCLLFVFPYELYHLFETWCPISLMTYLSYLRGKWNWTELVMGLRKE